MSKFTGYKSDQSGKVIADGQVAKVRISFSDGRKGVREADLTEQEAEELASAVNARQAARRGRRPQSQN